jgi:SP family general alpha glucoside:H+ symporter-like MFS transporter
MIGSMVFMVGAICIPFFSTSLEMFLVGGIIQGLPWGVFQTLAISYAADLCPTHLRGTNEHDIHRNIADALQDI